MDEKDDNERYAPSKKLHQPSNASPLRQPGASPRFAPSVKDNEDDEGEESGGSRIRDRSKSIDYAADIASPRGSKGGKNGRGRDARSASVWEGEPLSSTQSATSSTPRRHKKSSSVRNALTCFIPGMEGRGSKEIDLIKDKKKMGEMILADADRPNGAAEGDDGNEIEGGKRKKRKREKKGEEVTFSSSSSSISSSSSASRPSSPPSSPVHRLAAGLTFKKGYHRRDLSSLEGVEYTNLVVAVPSFPVAAPGQGDSAAQPASRPSRKNTLSPHMRSSSDRFAYDSKRTKSKGKKGKKDSKSESLGGPSSGLAKESRTNRRSSDDSSDDDVKAKKGSGKKGKEREKNNKKKDKRDQQVDHLRQQDSPNSRLVTSLSWRGKKTSQSDTALERPDSKGSSLASTAPPARGTHIVTSPRKPMPVFPKSKQRLSFSGWLSHFNQQVSPAPASVEVEPKRKYKEGTVAGFLEDLQLDEHVNELVKVRGIESMDRLFEVTVQQFYDMDIPTSDLRVLIEEVNKRKNPPPPPAVEETSAQEEPSTAENGEPEPHNNSNLAEALRSSGTGTDGDDSEPKHSDRHDTEAKGGHGHSHGHGHGGDKKAKRRSVHKSDKRKSQRREKKEVEDGSALALEALEQRLKEEIDRRTKAEQEKEEAMRALETEKQRANDMERMLAEALARIQAMEQSVAAAAAAAASTKRKKETKTKAKAKAKAKKEERKKKKNEEKREAKEENENGTKEKHEGEGKGKEASAVVVADEQPPQPVAVAKGAVKEEEDDGKKKATVPPTEKTHEDDEGVIQYHYPLPLRVPSARISRRLSLKVKSPASSPRGASPRGVPTGSEGRMRQAEKETFEQKKNDVRQWIEAATKESFPSADFFQSLRSGVLLCKLLNFISPGAIKELHVADMPFYQMENITYFVQGCRKLGVKTVFEPADLYHGKNLEAVLSCLDALDRWARRSTTYEGPYLVRSTSHSQFIRSLSGKLILDKDTITKKDNSAAGETRSLSHE